MVGGSFFKASFMLPLHDYYFGILRLKENGAKNGFLKLQPKKCIFTIS